METFYAIRKTSRGQYAPVFCIPGKPMPSVEHADKHGPFDSIKQAIEDTHQHVGHSIDVFVHPECFNDGELIEPHMFNATHAWDRDDPTIVDLRRLIQIAADQSSQIAYLNQQIQSLEHRIDKSDGLLDEFGERREP